MLPPAVAGIALLAALGPQGILGGLLSDLHIELVLQTAGVVVALAFVASPFYIRAAYAAFEAVDRSFLEASADLGAREPTTLLRVALPIARPGLVVGLALAWGRALGEFGATLMFAGSFAGRHADRAAGDLRPVRDRPARGARALRGARGGLGGAARGDQALRPRIRRGVRRPLSLRLAGLLKWRWFLPLSG